MIHTCGDWEVSFMPASMVACTSFAPIIVIHGYLDTFFIPQDA